MALELLVPVGRAPEHREGEGAAVLWGGDDAGGEAEVRALARPEHVDHARLTFGRATLSCATQRYLGEGTVKTHVSHVLGKLGLRDRVQAVVFAYESGLVEPGEV